MHRCIGTAWAASEALLPTRDERRVRVTKHACRTGVGHECELEHRRCAASCQRGAHKPSEEATSLAHDFGVRYHCVRDHRLPPRWPARLQALPPARPLEEKEHGALNDVPHETGEPREGGDEGRQNPDEHEDRDGEDEGPDEDEEGGRDGGVDRAEDEVAAPSGEQEQEKEERPQHCTAGQWAPTGLQGRNRGAESGEIEERRGALGRTCENHREVHLVPDTVGELAHVVRLAD